MKKRLLIILAIAISLAAGQLIAGGKDVSTGLDSKEAVCHKPNTPAEKTLWVPPVAVWWHVAHGDYEGVCGEDPS